MAQKLPIWFQTHTVSSPRKVLVGLTAPNKAPTTSISGVFIKFSECQTPCTHEKPRYWWVSGDGSGLAVCRPKFLTTKNRRLNNSDMCLSLHITRRCQTFFQRENFAQIFKDFARISNKSNTGQQIFGLVFFSFDFLVFLDVFWCAESENDVSFFVLSAVFL